MNNEPPSFTELLQWAALGAVFLAFLFWVLTCADPLL